MGRLVFFAVGLCDCQVNLNRGMMFRVLLVLMVGPDTGPLLLLYPHTVRPSAGRAGDRTLFFPLP